MKLSDFRVLIQKHDTASAFRKLLLGENKELSQFKMLVKNYDSFSPDYELCYKDVLQIMNIMSSEEHPLVQAIKLEYFGEYLYEIITAFLQTQIIDDSHFLILSKLSRLERLHIFKLFSNDPAASLPKTLLNFNKALYLIKYHTAPRELMASLLLLEKHKQLEVAVFTWLSKNSATTPEISFLLTTLDNANCLAQSLKNLMATTSPSTIHDIIVQLGAAKISLDADLVRLICQHQFCYSLSSLLAVIMTAKIGGLNKILLLKILNFNENFFINIVPALKLLHAHNLLTIDLFNAASELNSTVCAMYYEKILLILSSKSLLSQNATLITSITYPEFSFDRMYNIMTFLEKNDALDQDRFCRCCIAITLHSNQNNPSTLDYFDIFTQLHQNDILITDRILYKLELLNNAKTRRVLTSISHLLNADLLNQQNLELAIDRVTDKLPPITEAAFVKVHRKQSNAPRSEMIFNDNIHLFPEVTSNDEQGAYAKIKRAFATPLDATPKYAIKKLFERSADKALLFAKREVKYHQLLGRKAFFYCKDKSYRIAIEWQAERSLHLTCKEELISSAYLDRLQCLVVALTEIEALHSRLRVHGDLKAQNVILNLAQKRLTLIDFSGSHKCGSAKFYIYTANYKDKSIKIDHLSNDVYATHIIIMHLFPEIYTVTYTDKGFNAQNHKDEPSVIEQAIMLLVDAMKAVPFTKRCTNADALAFCHKLIEQYATLDDDKLRFINIDTLARTYTTVEDALRGTIR